MPHSNSNSGYSQSDYLSQSQGHSHSAQGGAPPLDGPISQATGNAAPSSSRQQDAGGGLGGGAAKRASVLDLARTGLQILKIRKDDLPESGRQPRRESMEHIATVLKQEDLQGRETVGSGVRNSIEAIWTVAGEHGARDVHKVLTDPELSPLYKLPANDPGARAAHAIIAAKELEYWTQQHQIRPSVGTTLATALPAATRAGIQERMGSVGTTADRFVRHAASLGDQFGHGHYFPSSTRKHSPPGYRSTTSASNNSHTR
ncbi:hypothetical protein QFZ63_000123 [Streptomyces sp. B3I7]|nr:hypothetical protein [Streptomyces sp. B3I7]